MAERKKAPAKAAPKKQKTAEPPKAPGPESLDPDAISAAQRDDLETAAENAEGPPVGDLAAYGTAAKSGAERTVVRQRDGVWWCPFCDHSQPVDFDVCQGCGAKRGS